MSDLFENGFFVRQPAWHGKGVVLADYPGRDEAMKIAGHNHQIVTRPIFIGEWVDEAAGIAMPGNEMAARYVSRHRADTGELVAVLPASQTVIQNDVPWDMIDEIVAQEHVRYETAGILGGVFDPESGQQKGGTVYWTLAHLDEPVIIDGDTSPIYPFILGTWSHDGSQALRIKETGVRVVCANTQSAALRGGGKDHLDLSFRHTKNVESRLKEARMTLGHVRDAHHAFVLAANELAHLTMSEAALRTFVETIVPMPVLAPGVGVTDRVVHNIEKARGDIWGILNGVTCTGIRNTGWGALQAGGEYFDHFRRSTSSDSYFKRNLMREDDVKANLAGVIREVAAAH